MRTRYHDHGMMTDEVHLVVEHEVQPVDRRLAHVEDDLKSLDVSIDHHLRDNTYTATLLLRVPGAELVAKGNGRRREIALRDAFADLADTLEDYLAKLRGESGMRREEKFHRDKAALTAEIIDGAQGWPTEPPRSDAEAESWAKPPVPTGHHPPD
jgi:hypothetical protein